MLSAISQNATTKAKGYRVFITLNGVVTSNLPYYVAPDFDGEHNFYLHGIHYIVVRILNPDTIIVCLCFLLTISFKPWLYGYRPEKHLLIGKKTTKFVISLTKRTWLTLTLIRKTIVCWNVESRKFQSDVDVHHGSFHGIKTKDWWWIWMIL